MIIKRKIIFTLQHCPEISHSSMFGKGRCAVDAVCSGCMAQLQISMLTQKG